MKALPVAMAIGAIHNGTMTGKLKGDARDDAGRLPEGEHVDTGETWSEYSPF